MIVFSPDSLEILKRVVCVQTDRHHLCIGAINGFSLAPSGSALATDASKLKLWDIASVHMSKDAILDEGYPKAVSEFLAYGACYAQATSSSRQPVSASIALGALFKQLAVFGDRTFTALGTISSPLPFSRIALTPENAFGGPGFSENPYGKGFSANGTGQPVLSSMSLPNVEAPEQIIISHADTPHPAGFWALPPDSPRRMQHLGTFDEAWKHNRWPHLPTDTKAAYFQVAPEDQRLNGYFVGDERIEIHNMHPRAQVVQTNLPGQRLRVLVARDGPKGEIDEYTTHIDTVWLFVDALAGFQLFRSVIPTKDADASEITHLYMAIESLHDSPLAFDVHLERFRRQMGEQQSSNKSDDFSKAQDNYRSQEAPGSSSPQPSAISPLAASLVSADGTPLQAEPLDGIAELDLSSQEISQALTKVQLEPGSEMATLAPEIAALLGQEGAKPVSELQTLIELRSELLKNNEELRKVLKDVRLDDPKLIESLRSNPETAEASLFLQSAPSTLEQMMQEMEKGLDDIIELEQNDPTPIADEPVVPAVMAASAPAQPEEQPISREWVIKQHQGGKSLAGYDLSGLDLSGLDLRGADFGKTVLSNANFSDTQLQAAVFQGAILGSADFTRADLSEANLRDVTAQATRLPGANLMRASLRNADFSGADLSATNLTGADFKSCVLSRARLHDAIFTDAVGDKAQFDETDCSRCDFTRARLQSANFYGSMISQAHFKESDCRKTDFSAAQASGSRFEASDLSDSQADFKSSFDQAVFISANLTNANWHKASLKGCNFDRSTLSSADLTGCNLRQSILIGVQAKNICLDRCDLTEVDLSGANLFEASMRSSNLQDAKMVAANLYGTDFLNAQFNGADWRDSIVARSLLEFRKP